MLIEEFGDIPIGKLTRERGDKIQGKHKETSK
jgi:hypothetical protein